MTYSSKIVKGVFFLTIAIALGLVLSYVLKLYLANSFSPEDFGLFYAVLTLVIFFSTFGKLGLDSALIKLISEFNVKKDHSSIKTSIIASTIFQLSSALLLSTIFLLAANVLSVHYFKTPLAVDILRILTLFVLFSSLQNIIASSLRGFQDTIWYSLAEPVRILSTLIYSMIFLSTGKGLSSIAISFFLGTLTSSIILLIGFSKYFFIFLAPIKKFWPITKRLFGFGRFVILSSIANRVIGFVDVLLLTWLSPLAMVGIYSVILPSAHLLLFFSTAIATLLFPLISELVTKKDFSKIADTISKFHTYSLILIIPASLFILYFSNYFIEFMFGYEYILGSAPFKILLIGMLPQSISLINFKVLDGSNKPRLTSYTIIFGAIINFTLNLILIPQFNILGAAIATSFSYFFMSFLSSYHIFHTLKVYTFDWKAWIRIIVSVIFFIVSIIFVNKLYIGTILLNVILSFILASTIYLISLLVLEVISIKEIKNMISLVSKKNLR